MFTLIFLAPIILTIIVVRLLFRALGFGRRYRQPFMGYGSGYNNGFGYGYGNRFGCRHRRGFGGGLFTILALVALDRLFTRRW
jgi:hypothetical protein